METSTNIFTHAGLTKIPLYSSNSSIKTRLYFFSDQTKEVVTQVRNIFQLKIKRRIYEGSISKIFNNIEGKPYLLRKADTFKLIAKDEVIQLDEVTAYHKLGEASQSLGEYQKAIDYHDKALKIALALKDQEGERAAYGNLGNTYHYLGNYLTAIEFHGKRLEIALQLKNHREEKIAYNNLGFTYCALGDYGKAIKSYKNCLKKFVNEKVSLIEESVYTSLGNAYHSLGKYHKALNSHQKALNIALYLRSRKEAGKVYCNLGNVYDSLGQYYQAIESHQKALDIALHFKNYIEEEKAYCHLGITYHALGESYKAIEFHQKALKIANDFKNLTRKGKIFCNLGNAYDSLGECHTAIQYYNEALKIAIDLKDFKEEGTSYINLGNAYHGLRQYDQAISYHEKALKIANDHQDLIAQGKIYCNLGSVSIVSKEYSQAIKYFDQDLKIALYFQDHVAEMRANGNLGVAYHFAEQYDKSKECYYKSIQILKSLQQAVKKTQWQITLFEAWSKPYINLEKNLTIQNKIVESLEISDNRRYRALSSLISKKLSSDHQDQDLVPLTFQQMQELAQKLKTTFIVYSLVHLKEKVPCIYAWTISPNKSSPDCVPLSSLPGEFLNSSQIFEEFPYKTDKKLFKSRKKEYIKQFHEKLSGWYHSLIAPLSNYLPSPDSKQTLTIIPDGFLAHLPFGIFCHKKNSEDTTYQYLIEQYPISIAPSIQVLNQLDQLPKPSSNKALLMGMPSAPNEEELPYSKQEVVRIGKVIRLAAPSETPSERVVFLQKEAHRENFFKEAPQARVIHIASHGSVEVKPLDNPDPHSVFKGLFHLAPTEKYPLGHLHAKEIAEMTLKADLVFMSACHLGRGNLQKEGSIGPIWSFLGSGAKSTVASYWPLADADTLVKVVETFYKHFLGYRTPKLTKAEALQKAALVGKKGFQGRPDLWGPLLLTGLIE